jgi:hypothetical protein
VNQTQLQIWYGMWVPMMFKMVMVVEKVSTASISEFVHFTQQHNIIYLILTCANFISRTYSTLCPHKKERYGRHTHTSTDIFSFLERVFPMFYLILWSLHYWLFIQKFFFKQTKSKFNKNVKLSEKYLLQHKIRFFILCLFWKIYFKLQKYVIEKV